VEAGFGLALLQESSVDEELRAGTLRVLPVAGLRVTIPVVLIHRRRGHLSAAAHALAALLVAGWERWSVADARVNPPRRTMATNAST
jgi:DNA-binding transcriptional LysR family regulator